MARRVRILRSRDPFTATTLQPGRTVGLGGKNEISKNEFIQNGRPTTRAKRAVRRLFVRDPYNMNSVSGLFATGATVARFSPEADQFTDNANTMYDPSKAPGAVREVSVASARKRANTPGKASRGHMKAIRRTLFNQTGGKTLRRR